MPSAVILECSSQDKLDMRQIQGRGLHGMFLEALRRLDPTLSAKLHKGDGIRPFTLGLPGKWFGPTSPYNFRFRLTLLDDSLLDMLRLLIQATQDDPLHIGQNRFHLTRMYQGSVHTDIPWAGSAMWHDLRVFAGTSNKFTLHFQTPVCFRQSTNKGGLRIEQPIPLPHLVLGSVYKRWQEFAPPQFRLDDDLIDVIEENVACAAPFELRSCVRNLDFAQDKTKSYRHRFHGTVGRASYIVVRNQDTISEDKLQQINALTDALFFTGAGYKTTMGMGMARRLNDTRDF